MWVTPHVSYTIGLKHIGAGVVTRVRIMVGIRVVRMCDVHHHAAMHARMMYIIIQNDTPMLFKLAEFLLILSFFIYFKC